MPTWLDELEKAGKLRRNEAVKALAVVEGVGETIGRFKYNEAFRRKVSNLIDEVFPVGETKLRREFAWSTAIEGLPSHDEIWKLVRVELEEFTASLLTSNPPWLQKGSQQQAIKKTNVDYRLKNRAMSSMTHDLLNHKERYQHIRAMFPGLAAGRWLQAFRSAVLTRLKQMDPGDDEGRELALLFLCVHTVEESYRKTFDLQLIKMKQVTEVEDDQQSAKN